MSALIKASDLMVKALENEGVEYIFAVPGEENLDFLDSLQHSSIRLIVTRHEQGAAFMAATYGRMTGKPGVCLSTLGPGATNFATPAAYATLAGMPLVMITGQKPIKKSKQGRFQIIDIVSMMKPVCKSTRQIVNAHMIPAMIRESFRLATEEKPGTVLLELPEDVAAESTDDWDLFEPTNPSLPTASDEAIEEAVRMIKEAQYPLVIVGAGANRKNVHHALVRFIEETGFPFVNTQMGKGAVGYKHREFMGTAALSSSDHIHDTIQLADLILVVGHDVVEKPPFFQTTDGAKVIHINYYSAVMDEVYFPQLEVVGHVGSCIDKLRLRLKASPEAMLMDFTPFVERREAIAKVIHQDDEDPRFPMLPQRIVADVRKALKEDAILSLDNGVYKIWFARNYHTYLHNTVLLDNALATMGAGLPAAMMCALMYPERQVLCVSGDGGFMMNSQELETAIRLKLNLVILILVDNGYGMIKWKQEAAGFNDWGLDFDNPDFKVYAEAYGANGHRFDHADDLVPLIQSCFEAKGVHLIEVPIDYSENYRI